MTAPTGRGIINEAEAHVLRASQDGFASTSSGVSVKVTPATLSATVLSIARQIHLRIAVRGAEDLSSGSVTPRGNMAGLLFDVLQVLHQV